MDHKIEALLDHVCTQSKIQFGDAVESTWIYDRKNCPGCGKGASYKSRPGKALSINAFLYRPQGVLIGYILCKKCGVKVRRTTRKALLHTTIEHTLSNAYLADADSLVGRRV